MRPWELVLSTDADRVALQPVLIRRVVAALAREVEPCPDVIEPRCRAALNVPDRFDVLDDLLDRLPPVREDPGERLHVGDPEMSAQPGLGVLLVVLDRNRGSAIEISLFLSVLVFCVESHWLGRDRHRGVAAREDCLLAQGDRDRRGQEWAPGA